MQVYTSFLRGINVSGVRTVDMDELRRVFLDAGFEDVVTYINSGNVVFRSGRRKKKAILELLEKKILDKFGFEVKVSIARSS